MAEYSPPPRRGFFSALPFVGIQAGTLLAAAVWALMGLAPDDVLYGWLWRVPFLASIVLIVLAVFIRLRLKESPTFVELEKRDQVAEHPLPELFRTARGQVWRGIGLRMAENGGSYLFSTLSITFVTSGAVGLGKSIGPLAVAVASGLGILTVPLAGALSDRFGRIPVYRTGAIFMALLSLPAWYLLSLGNPVLVVARRRPRRQPRGEHHARARSARCCPNCSETGIATSGWRYRGSSRQWSPVASRHCWASGSCP